MNDDKDPIPPKKSRRGENLKGKDKSDGTNVYPPETKGKFTRGPLDWSLDELIEYRSNGTAPKRIPDAEMLRKMGAAGLPMETVCDLFQVSRDKFCSNLDWYDNWKLGKAEIGARNRAMIVAQALEQNVLNAQIYIDKIFMPDSGTNSTVQVTVTNSEQLKPVSTEDLLEVMFKETNKGSDESK
tara:strand:+ start:133 stop:684 length:552 start_codon:yes stop_codon:yes gene_type:complete